MQKVNLVIVGSGPAAYTAAIYAARAELEPYLFEGFQNGPLGGQLTTTTMVENYPGFPEGVLGPDLMENFKKQALKHGTKIFTEDVVSVDLKSQPFSVEGSKTKLEAQSLIIATGASSRKLDVPGVEKFWQKGVSTCAVCDGALPMFRDQPIFVIGGGDSAAEEALFLTKFASQVYIVHRRDQLKASSIMAKRVLAHDKIKVLYNRELSEVLGDKTVQEVVLKDVVSSKTEKIKGAGLFFAIGHVPNTAFLKDQLELKNDYIVTKEGRTLTSIEGVFAAGDVQDYIYKQAVTAAGSGCMAALDAEKWLSQKGFSKK